MTKLATYLESAGLTQVEFGERIGANQSLVSQWSAGVRRPGLALALAIEKATGGAVPASYWVTMKTTAGRSRPRRKTG